MVPADSPIKTLADLKGKKLGVAGGPLDKSWLLLVAYALRTANLDLRTETTQVFGAPPLLAERAKQGEIDAVLNFWPYAARLEAAGFTQLIGLEDVVRELGAKGEVAMVGFAFSEAWAKKNLREFRHFCAPPPRPTSCSPRRTRNWDAAQGGDGRERSQLQRGNLRGASPALSRGHPRTVGERERGRRQGALSVLARTWRREARRPCDRACSRHILERQQIMTVIDAREDRVQGARALSGPMVSVLSIAGFLLLWFIAAQMAESRLLPGPGAVLEYIYEEAVHGDLLTELGITLWRVAASFVVAMLIGSVIGLAMGQMPGLNRFLDPWLIVLLNLPALVIIILAYVWFGLNEAAAIGAVALNKIPNVVVTLREGARALDPGLDEMARAYRLSPMSKLRNVTLPQLQPYFAAASRTGLSLIWKIVLVVELLGRPNGVGFELHLNFQLFNVTAILGYTLAFVAVMLAIEYLLVQPIERHSTRWRNKPV